MNNNNKKISKIRNKKGEITQTPRKFRESSETTLRNYNFNKLENLDEVKKFLDTYDHPKLNQEDINHLNRSITNNEIEAAVKSLPKKKIQDMMDS
jgi:hypothetical protein